MIRFEPVSFALTKEYVAMFAHCTEGEFNRWVTPLEGLVIADIYDVAKDGSEKNIGREICGFWINDEGEFTIVAPRPLDDSPCFGFTIRSSREERNWLEGYDFAECGGRQLFQ